MQALPSQYKLTPWHFPQKASATSCALQMRRCQIMPELLQSATMPSSMCSSPGMLWPSYHVEAVESILHQLSKNQDHLKP